MESLKLDGCREGTSRKREMKVVKHDVRVNQPAKEVWRVWIKNLQVSIPRIVPKHYHSVEYLDGPPLAPGGVYRVNYSPQFGHFEYFTGVWEEIDHKNYSFRLRISEGGHLGKASLPIIYSVKLLPGDKPNSCIKKWTFEYVDKAEDKVHQLLKDEVSCFGASLDSYLASQSPSKTS